MKKHIENGKETPDEEPVVIPDECGDTLWDAVLAQPAFEHAVSILPTAKPEEKTLKQA